MADAATMDSLYRQLHVWAATPHEWSYCDCYTILGDWVQIVCGFDPAAEVRGTYGDPEMCPIARGYRADPIPICSRLFEPLPVTDAPVYGDVALVTVPGTRFLCGAILLKKGNWAMKTEKVRGMTFARSVRPTRAWSVGYAP
jgi:hypothetical protein